MSRGGHQARASAAPVTSRIDTAVYVEPKPRAVAGWTPARIKQAERLADTGDLSQAADLCELLQADDNISGLVATLGGVASLPLSFESPANDNGGESPIAIALERDWYRFADEDTQTQVIGWLRILGVAFVHVREWRLDPEVNRRLPVVEVWHPGNFKFDFKTRKWTVKLEGGKTETIEAGDGRWLVLSAYDRLRPWSRAPWRALARYWLLKQHAISDWGFYSNRHGSGLIVAQNANSNVSVTPKARAELAADLRQLGRNGVLALPDGFEMKLVESTARTWETFTRQIDQADQASALALTGNNLGSKVDGQGSYAAASVHERVTQSRIRAIAASLSTAFRNQLLVWYVKLNFGDPGQTPYPLWDTRPPADRKADAETLSAAADALTKLIDAGVPVDLQAFSERFDIPLDPKAKGKLGDPAKTARALVRGLLERAQSDSQNDGLRYLDGLEATAIQGGAKALEVYVDGLVELVSSAGSLAELRQTLPQWYAKHDVPEEFADFVDRAEMLAAMAGRRSAVIDL